MEHLSVERKSFLWGGAVGIAITLLTLFLISLAMNLNSEQDPIQYLKNPVSYENKKETSFKVLQVLGNAALANEESGEDSYYGNTVLLLGENYYSHQIVMVKKPQRIGTYSYTNNGGLPMTVPVIK